MPVVGKHLGTAEVEQLEEIKRLGEVDNRTRQVKSSKFVM